MNISFLTSGHDPFDDRIFYHMARSLVIRNNNIEIVCSKLALTEVKDGIRLNCFAGDNLPKRDKINQFIKRLSSFKADVIICSEPLTLLAAKQYSKRHPAKTRIFYDITEWYPSKKNLIAYKAPVRWFIFTKLLLFNYWVSGYADSFIFGEWFKSKPYRFLFPNKPFIYTSYYPDLEYIRFCTPEIKNDILRLSYSGKISLEKGYGNFFSLLKMLSECNPELKIEVKIFGWYENHYDEKECENLINSAFKNITINVSGKQSFKTFIEAINKTDIFLDLRSDNFENQRSLPIKLFYYAALGRPVIFTDLKSIRKEVDIDMFGFLVNPTDTMHIVQLINNYIEDKELYYSHCENAKRLSENNYSWQKIEPQFVRFITSVKPLRHK